MNLIEININNSFNKERNSSDEEVVIGDSSTVNKGLDNRVEVSSVNIASLTNSVVTEGHNHVFIKDGEHKTIVREIFIAVFGTAIGSIITYAVINFFN